MTEDTETYRLQYEKMLKRNEKIVFSICFFYANHAVPFDDLRQEVLASLWKSYKNFRGECMESTWVYRVCLNTCLFSIKKYTPKIKFSPLENLPKLAEESGMATTEQLEWLYSAIAKLHPLDKAMILMWLDELSYNDIADNIGIPRNTVATRLHRIRKKLSEFK